jgi:hypothetical protein
MLDDGLLIPIAFFVSVTMVILGVARIISDGRTRRRLIESGGSAEVSRALAAHQDEHGLFGALKWGIVAIATGLAFVIVQFLPYRDDDPIMFGIVLLFLGAGLLTYYVAARRLLVRQAPELGREAAA